MPLMAPGALFIGSIYAQERPVLGALLKGARVSGRYTRVVEPAAGAFAVSQMAAQVGWQADAFDCSDIGLFSAVMAAGVLEPDEQRQRLASMNVRVRDVNEVPDLDMGRASHLLWLIGYLTQRAQATNLFAAEMLRDTLAHRARHIARIEQTLAQAATLLRGMRYRALDMNAHLDEALDDERAVIMVNPPTYKAGYEKFYDMQDCLEWDEPPYEQFDPQGGLEALWERIRGARALVTLYQERPRGLAVGDVFYCREAARGQGADAFNAYLACNRPDEAVALLGAQGAVFRGVKASDLERVGYASVPPEWTPPEPEDATIGLVKLKEPQVRYLRQLWTHNFQPSGASDAFAVLVNGQMVGVFGYQTTWTFWSDPSRLFLLFNMSPAIGTRWRLTRLLQWVALTREMALSVLPPMVRDGVERVFTTQLTHKPDSMDKRGLMQLVKRTPDKEHGYKLVYDAPLRDWTVADAYAHWLADERASQQRRDEARSPETKRPRRERRTLTAGSETAAVDR